MQSLPNGARTMLRLVASLIAHAALLALASAEEPDHSPPTVFLVKDIGMSILQQNGEELYRIGASSNVGALSPDGQFLAHFEVFADGTNPQIVIRPPNHPEPRTTIRPIWGTTGTSCQFVWAPNVQFVLISEAGPSNVGRAHRIYNLANRTLVEVTLPDEYWVTDWGRDGRFLADTRGNHDSFRIAWVSDDGARDPEFITSEDEIAGRAKLSPDGRRILCLVRDRGEGTQMRLTVIDLQTMERTIVDEPGMTSGHCWSPDGSKIAYTWQPLLDNPADVAQRETMLLSCAPDGSGRTTITTRTKHVSANSSGRSGHVIFFRVLDWRLAPVGR